MPNDNKPCIAFSLKDAKEAMQHMKEREVIERYGGQCNGHLLHTWDDGECILFKCKNCGGYILVHQNFMEWKTLNTTLITSLFPVRMKPWS